MAVEMKVQQTAPHYPSLRRPLSLAARFLEAGEVLEGLATGSRGPTPYFPLTTLRTEEPSEVPTKHREYIRQWPEAVLQYTNGSKTARPTVRVSLDRLPPKQPRTKTIRATGGSGIWPM